jgi:hypothetical protein
VYFVYIYKPYLNMDSYRPVGPILGVPHDNACTLHTVYKTKLDASMKKF